MGAVKLKKHGNSYGFTIPSNVLNEALFDVNGVYEMMVSKHAITFIKRRADQKNWTFTNSELSEEDKEWLESDFGKGNE